jgi:hypothetical protein
MSTEHVVKANGIKTSKRTKTLHQSNIKPILSVLDHDGVPHLWDYPRVYDPIPWISPNPH